MIDKNDEQSIRKEFNLWNRVKTELQLYGRKPKISNGQIWWAGVGKNIGTEINGKNSRFSRPMLVYRKLSGEKLSYDWKNWRYRLRIYSSGLYEIVSVKKYLQSCDWSRSRKSRIHFNSSEQPPFCQEVMATAGHEVEFIREAKVRTADILLDNVMFEIKSPKSFNANSFEHLLKRGTRQSPNLIIDSSRLRGVVDKKVEAFLVNQVKKQKQIKRLIFINKRGVAVDINEVIW